jgi:hypothetical protein
MEMIKYWNEAAITPFTKISLATLALPMSQKESTLNSSLGFTMKITQEKMQTF